MKIIADLHIHSKYSRAVSGDMTLENIASHARKKGIQVVATGDFTHPAWFGEIKINYNWRKKDFSISNLKSQISNLQTHDSCLRWRLLVFIQKAER